MWGQWAAGWRVFDKGGWRGASADLAEPWGARGVGMFFKRWCWSLARSAGLAAAFTTCGSLISRDKPSLYYDTVGAVRTLRAGEVS